jgi:hypothetical protein
MKTYQALLSIQHPGDGIVQSPAGRIRKIRNLRPILNLARRELVSFICASPLNKGEASLEVHFASGHRCLIRFASLKVCQEFAANPRRVWNRRGDLLK